MTKVYCFHCGSEMSPVRHPKHGWHTGEYICEECCKSQECRS
jgi:hypothetical protein